MDYSEVENDLFELLNNIKKFEKIIDLKDTTCKFKDYCESLILAGLEPKNEKNSLTEIGYHTLDKHIEVETETGIMPVHDFYFSEEGFKKFLRYYPDGKYPIIDKYINKNVETMLMYEFNENTSNNYYFPELKLKRNNLFSYLNTMDIEDNLNRDKTNATHDDDSIIDQGESYMEDFMFQMTDYVLLNHKGLNGLNFCYGAQTAIYDINRFKIILQHDTDGFFDFSMINSLGIEFSEKYKVTSPEMIKFDSKLSFEDVKTIDALFRAELNTKEIKKYLSHKFQNHETNLNMHNKFKRTYFSRAIDLINF